MDPVIGIQSVWIQSQITQSLVPIKHYLVMEIWPLTCQNLENLYQLYKVKSSRDLWIQ